MLEGDNGELSFISGDEIAGFRIETHDEARSELPERAVGASVSEHVPDLGSRDINDQSEPDRSPERTVSSQVVGALSGNVSIGESDFSLSRLPPWGAQVLSEAAEAYQQAVLSGKSAVLGGHALSVGRVAERLQRGDVFLVASKLALFSGSYKAAELLAGEAVTHSASGGWLIAACAAAARDEPQSCARHLAEYLSLPSSQVTQGARQEAAELLRLLISSLDGVLQMELAGVVAGRGSKIESRLFADEFKSAPSTAHGEKVTASSTPGVNSETQSELTPGVVDRLFPSKGYGFVRDAGGARYLFRFGDVVDTGLSGLILQGTQGIHVRFVGTTEVGPTGSKKVARFVCGSRPLERAFAADAVDAPKSGGVAPPRRRAKPAPKDRYRRAKQAELDNDLALARRLFLEEIEGHGPRRESALKDLAWLLNRLGEWEEALRLLDRYGTQFSKNQRPILQLRLNIMLKGKQYERAREVIGELKSDSDVVSGLSLAKQDVYCLLALGKPKEALQVVDGLIREFPHDGTLADYREEIDKLATRGDLSQVVPDEKQLLVLQSYGLGLSTFAVHALQSCQMTGLDERSKARGYFMGEDFKAVERYLERIRGQRPKERADAALTLAYMCWKEPGIAGQRNLRDLLRRYFSLMAEAGWHANNDPDAVRAYAAEALALSRRKDVSQNLPVLLASYLGATSTTSNRDASSLVQQFTHAQERHWSRFTQDLPYFMSRCSEVLPELRSLLTDGNTALNLPEDLPDLLREEISRQSIESTQLDHLVVMENLSAALLQELSEGLEAVEERTRFALDKRHLAELSRIVKEIAAYWVEKDYTEKASLHSRSVAALDRAANTITINPTQLAIGHLVPLCSRLRELVDEDYATFEEEARPALTVRNVLENDQYQVMLDGTITVSLELILGAGSPPLEDISISAEEGSGLTTVDSPSSSSVLRAGGRTEVRLRIRPDAQRLADQAFTLEGAVHYRSRGHAESLRFSLPIRIDNESKFEEIPNPYAHYSGGTVVADPHMFFGREDLLCRIEEQVAFGPLGQCFVMYGQKRSGKTSVLVQLRRRLNPSILAVYLTLGAMDTDRPARGFARLCIDQLKYACKDRGIEGVPWPSDEAINDGPIEWLRRTLKAAGDALSEQLPANTPRIVLLVDEFTYIYSDFRQGLVDSHFMRQWKALLESRLFSAVLVGQDSMPAFKAAFPNEFGVTHDERISYLSSQEAEALATEPMSLNGHSRYRGSSLTKLLALTAGSPWFMQIMCDELVRLLNLRRARYVTEADVEGVVRNLVSGNSMLPIERFDPFITPAGQGSASAAPRQAYLELLADIAAESTGSSGARLDHLPDASGKRDVLIDDMVERQVLVRESGTRVRISVGLFEEWLRVNRPRAVAVNQSEPAR